MTEGPHFQHSRGRRRRAARLRVSGGGGGGERAGVAGQPVPQGSGSGGRR